MRAQTGEYRHVMHEEDRGTEPVMHRVTADGARNRQGAVRRRQDARMFEALAKSRLPCELAFERIAKGYLVVTGQVRLRVSRMNDLPPGQRDSEGHQDYINGLRCDYIEWVRRLGDAQGHPDRNIRHVAALDIISDGHSARYVDETRRKRKGWAMRNLLEVLEEYCVMKRWG